MGLLEGIKKYSQENPAINTQNKEAFSMFLELGFPTKNDEEWKYTSLKKIISKEYKIENKGEKINENEITESSLGLGEKIIFLNGELFKDPEISGVTVTKKTNGNPKYHDATTALNAAYAKNGYDIVVGKDTQIVEPLEILFLTKNTSNNFVQYNNSILLQENSSIKILENIKNLTQNLCFTNTVTEIKINHGGALELNKIQDHSDSQFLIDNTKVVQDNKSCSTINTILLGGTFTRNNLSFIQNGVHCESNMNGVTVLNNNEFGDHHTYIDHKNEKCESNELYKGVYAGKSNGVFNGKIMVQPGAQKINAFQANNNLLLSDDCSINSKPQLEIYADDVKCSHGCTIGQLDERALFYMRTRGISEKDARQILTFAFVAEALEKITVPSVYEKSRALVEAKLNITLSIEQ